MIEVLLLNYITVVQILLIEYFSLFQSLYAFNIFIYILKSVKAHNLKVVTLLI